MECIVPDHGESLVHTRKGSQTFRNISTFERTARKDSVDTSNTYEQTFTALVISPSVSISSEIHSFVSLSTVLRAHVPLAWLAGEEHSGQLQSGTLVKANILSVSRWDYQVLIARLVSDNRLYALERVDIDIYVCCPLRDCIKSRWIEQAVIGAAPLVTPDIILKSEQRHDHGRKSSVSTLVQTTGAVDSPASPKVPQNRRGKLARLSILESREKTEEPFGEEGSQIEEVSRAVAAEIPAQDIVASISINDAATGPLSEPLLGPINQQESANPIKTEVDVVTEHARSSIDQLSAEYLRKQYFETLYLSKTSLAFYAKGPLSRARARCRVPDASRSSQQLADFYQECILSTKRMDTKYNESIDKHIMLSLLHNSATVHNDQPKALSRKSRRTKLGKDALWPAEIEYIGRWWSQRAENTTSSKDANALKNEPKGAISQLRMRETEMHIILILEIFGLEAKDIPSQRNLKTTENPEIKLESIENEAFDSVSNALPKKKRDLKSELDLLVDRMCIWHTAGLEELVSPPNDGREQSAAPTKSKDRLIDLCKDVIVPFYGGKLPEICRSVCNKMGGPEMLPRKSKESFEKSAGQQIPHAPSSTNRKSSNKRPLLEVPGEGSSVALTTPITLVRSSTLPISTSLTRESSERPVSRSSLQKSMSFSNREVDLVADAKVTAAKRRKLDLVTAQKRELDAAIETLKRPNRSTVAKTFMDDMERRTTGERMGAKRVAPVQISATPKRGQAKQILVEEYDLPPIQMGNLSREQSTVPSSTNKSRGLSRLPNISRSSATKKAVLSAIHDTPSRHGAKENTMDSVTGEAGSKGCDVLNRASSSMLIASTPTTSRLRPDIGDSFASTPLRTDQVRRHVLFTPVKRSEAGMENVFKDVPEIPEHAGKMMDRVMGSKSSVAEMSIYESLGWDEDYDL